MLHSQCRCSTSADPVTTVLASPMCTTAAHPPCGREAAAARRNERHADDGRQAARQAADWRHGPQAAQPLRRQQRIAVRPMVLCGGVTAAGRLRHQSCRSRKTVQIRRISIRITLLSMRQVCHRRAAAFKALRGAARILHHHHACQPGMEPTCHEQRQGKQTTPWFHTHFCNLGAGSQVLSSQYRGVTAVSYRCAVGTLSKLSAKSRRFRSRGWI